MMKEESFRKKARVSQYTFIEIKMYYVTGSNIKFARSLRILKILSINRGILHKIAIE